MENLALITVYSVLHELTQSYAFEIWLGVGVVGLIAWGYFSHLLIRKLLGHRKWRGTWYTEFELQELVNILWEDQASGHRVMRRDEIELLREWTQGKDYKGLGLDTRDGY